MSEAGGEWRGLSAFRGHEIVAGPLPSRYGAKSCKICRRGISLGAMVCKLATPGKTTQHGQGPGLWIHEWCADLAVQLPSLEDDLVQQVLFDD